LFYYPFKRGHSVFGVDCGNRLEKIVIIPWKNGLPGDRGKPVTTLDYLVDKALEALDERRAIMAAPAVL
jgi:hypothetical protein